MKDASRNNKALPRRQFDRAALKINEQLPLDDVEELIIFVVLVPMVLAFDYPQSHYRIVNFTQGLVEPFVFTGIREGLFIDDFHCRIKDVQSCFVGIDWRSFSHSNDLNGFGSYVNSGQRSVRKCPIRDLLQAAHGKFPRGFKQLCYGFFGA
jgi:hypothetical protein